MCDCHQTQQLCSACLGFLYMRQGMIHKSKCWGHTVCQGSTLTRCNDWGFADKLQLRQKNNRSWVKSIPDVTPASSVGVTHVWIWPHVPHSYNKARSLLQQNQLEKGEGKKCFFPDHIKNNHFFVAQWGRENQSSKPEYNFLSMSGEGREGKTGITKRFLSSLFCSKWCREQGKSHLDIYISISIYIHLYLYRYLDELSPLPSPLSLYIIYGYL